MKTISDSNWTKPGISKKNEVIFFSVIMSVFILFIFPVLPVKAVVMVSPTRLTLEGGQRAVTVRLINTEDKQVTYRVTLIHSKMTEEGNIVIIEAPAEIEERLAERLAQDLIRYSPRQVTLPPKTTQLVRLQLRLPAGLEEGEYRSRLLFQEIPGQAVDDGDESENISVSLRIIYGVSIPVIIRHGETWAEAALSDLQLNLHNGGQPELSFIIKRKGNRSVYGDLEVTYVTDRGDKKIVGLVRGIAVYPEVEEREYKLGLRDAEEIVLEKGKLCVVYRRPSEEGGQVMAAAELDL